jgi:hypothetical protein
MKQGTASSGTRTEKLAPKPSFDKVVISDEAFALLRARIAAQQSKVSQNK